MKESRGRSLGTVIISILILILIVFLIYEIVYVDIFEIMDKRGIINTNSNLVQGSDINDVYKADITKNETKLNVEYTEVPTIQDNIRNK